MLYMHLFINTCIYHVLMDTNVLLKNANKAVLLNKIWGNNHRRGCDVEATVINASRIR